MKGKIFKVTIVVLIVAAVIGIPKLVAYHEQKAEEAEKQKMVEEMFKDNSPAPTPPPASVSAKIETTETTTTAESHIDPKAPEGSSSHNPHKDPGYRTVSDRASGSTREWRKIGDEELYVEVGMTDKEALEQEIEKMNTAIIEHKGSILLFEVFIARYERELFKVEHPEMTDEEEAEFEELTKVYEEKEQTYKQFIEEYPFAIPQPRP